MELCKCGHCRDDHDRDDPEFPDSTACQEDFCSCDMYEHDEESA